jgi:hypothetical protein
LEYAYVSGVEAEEFEAVTLSLTVVGESPTNAKEFYVSYLILREGERKL